jgi:hypothetical protein
MSSHTIVVYCLCFCRACVFARRLVAGKNGAVFVFGLRRLLCCGSAAMGAWSCATAHDHGLLRLRRHPGAPWAAPMASMFGRGRSYVVFCWSKVSYPIKGGNLAIFFCYLQVVCVVALAPWGALAWLQVSIDTINQLGGLA